MPPPPPPPPRKTTTMQMKQKLIDKKFVIIGTVLALVAIIAIGGGIMAIIGWMNTPNTDRAIAAATTHRDVPPMPTGSDMPDPADRGESDMVADDADPVPAAVVVVATAEPDAGQDNFEILASSMPVTVSERTGIPALPVAPTAVAAAAPVAPPLAAPPPALPPPAFSAAPTVPPTAAPTVAPVLIAAADTTSPCGTPEGLTDEGHLRCLDHALGLARALTPDWHPTAAP